MMILQTKMGMILDRIKTMREIKRMGIKKRIQTQRTQIIPGIQTMRKTSLIPTVTKAKAKAIAILVQRLLQCSQKGTLQQQNR
jgi:hypothetical protein